MPFKPGTRFGAYEIQAALGAGGMGEVYRARDTRLGRDVAVKILPEHQADAARRERFQREARAVAALSHPNICTIHDVGHEGGVDFLVMEFIDGESLATRLTRGPLPLAQALNLAMEIAEGLSAAHRQGIVHRDLKPGNVMLTRTGSGKPHAAHAKVLDFGLATILASDNPADEGRSVAETAAPALTQVGSMIGTPQYMAPEQIEGRRVDTRTDIFAFGAVLFEMLTGHLAFEASSSPGLMAAILKGETPSVTKHLSTSSPDLDWVVRTCLEKDPDDRFASMHDVLLQLRRIATEPAEKAAAVVPQKAPPLSVAMRALVAVAAIALVASAAYWWGRASDSPEGGQQMTFSLLLPEGLEFGPGISVSPDGQSVAAIGATPGTPQRQLWVRHLNNSAPTVFPGTDGAMYPFWSPDGRSIGFFTTNQLKRVEVSGGSPVVIGDVQSGRGGAWFEDGTIVVSVLETPGLFRMPASGGTLNPLLNIEEGSGIANLRYPVRVSSRKFLFLALADNEEESEVRLTSLDDPSSWVSVVRSRRNASYVNGFLLFEREGVTVSQAFDLGSGALSGEPRPVTETPPMALGNANIGFSSVASDGRTIAWPSRPQPSGHLTWLGRDGSVTGTLGEPGVVGGLALSPDEGRVAVVSRGRLMVMDTSSGVGQEIASERGLSNPKWSPDGARIAFTASLGPNATVNLYAVALGQPRKVEPLVEGRTYLQMGGWISTGEFLWLQPRTQTITGQVPGEAWLNERGVLARAPGGAPRLVSADPDFAVAVSADGRFIAYPRLIAGQWEVCVDALEAPRGCQLVGYTGAWPQTLVWRADGRELLFRTLDDVIMSVPMQPGVLPAGVKAIRLFQSRGTNGLAVTRNGERLLVFDPRTPPTPSVTVVANWSRTD